MMMRCNFCYRNLLQNLYLKCHISSSRGAKQPQEWPLPYWLRPFCYQTHTLSTRMLFSTKSELVLKLVLLKILCSQGLARVYASFIGNHCNRGPDCSGSSWFPVSFCSLFVSSPNRWHAHWHHHASHWYKQHYFILLFLNHIKVLKRT